MADEFVPDPVGIEFGIAARQDRRLKRPDYTSRELIGAEHYSAGTEFGGVLGIIQPTPHVPTAAERLRMIYAIDPQDPGDDPGRGSVIAPDLTGDFQ